MVLKQRTNHISVDTKFNPNLIVNPLKLPIVFQFSVVKPDVSTALTVRAVIGCSLTIS